MSAKAFYDKAVPTRNLVTTITGIVTLVVTILGASGVITLDQQAELQGHAVTVVEAGALIWGAVTSIILMFKAKDA
jgi:hypothetical protein